RDDPNVFVQEVVRKVDPGDDRHVVDGDARLLGVDAVPEASNGAVDGNASGGDQFLARAPRAEARSREHLLEALLHDDGSAGVAIDVEVFFEARIVGEMQPALERLDGTGVRNEVAE